MLASQAWCWLLRSQLEAFIKLEIVGNKLPPTQALLTSFALAASCSKVKILTSSSTTGGDKWKKAKPSWILSSSFLWGRVSKGGGRSPLPSADRGKPKACRDHKLAASPQVCGHTYIRGFAANILAGVLQIYLKMPAALEFPASRKLVSASPKR